MLKIPNVIIGGAPKSRTSSLYNWLITHKDVCHSTIRETYYLLDKGHPLQSPEYNYHLYGLEGYQKYSNHWSEERFFSLDYLRQLLSKFGDNLSLYLLEKLKENPRN